MNDNVGKLEKETQKRIIKFFHDELGYRYLGDWTDREGRRLWPAVS